MFALSKKHILSIILAILISFTLDIPVAAAGFSAKEMKKMSRFLSNFTELRMFNVNAKEMLNAQHPEEMIKFGIWHNYRNNFKSRIKHCTDKNCKWGSLTIDGAYVQESLKRYFDYAPAKMSSVERDGQAYHWDGRRYHFDGADGEATYYASVAKVERSADGLVHMSGVLYNVDDRNDVLGTFTALARPHKWKGRDTWALLELKTTMKD